MDEEEIDIAAAMGFSAFGGTKKRKYDQTKSPKVTTDASGANSTQLGVRTKKTGPEEGSEDSASNRSNVGISTTGHQWQRPPSKNGVGEVADYLARAENLTDNPENPTSVENASIETQNVASETVCFGGLPITKAELNALRYGVTTENGDTAYFLPNFIENPWAKIENFKND